MEDTKKLFGPLMHKKASIEHGERIFSMFKEAMESEGIPLRSSQTESQKEVTASSEVEDMQDRFVEEAHQALLAQVSARVYKDPILSGLLENGMAEKAAELATNRLADAATMKKWASLPVETIQELAMSVLSDELVEKVASEEEPAQKTHFPHLFGGRK